MYFIYTILQSEEKRLWGVLLHRRGVSALLVSTDWAMREAFVTWDGQQTDSTFLFVYVAISWISSLVRGRQLKKGIRMRPIGMLIKEELEAQERSVAWFARKLSLDRSSVYRLFQKNSIDTALLSRISVVLGKDFFSLLSDNLHERLNSQQ